MRRGLRIGFFALLAAVALAVSTLTVVAQGPGGQMLQRQPRPNANALNLRVPVVAKEMAEVLETWETKSGQIKRLEGNHQRFEFNDVFQVEIRGEGKFYYASPDKGHIEIKPSRVAGEKPRTPGFKLQPAKPEHWVCDGTKVTKINDDEKTYTEMEIPPQARGANIINSQLPFLFGMKAEQAKRRYQFKFLKDPTNYRDPETGKRQIVLAAKPNWEQDAQNFQEALILLDAESYLPVRVKLVDPTGKVATEYLFDDLKVDAKPSRIQKLFGIGLDDPFAPELKGFRKVDLEVGAQRGATAAPPVPAAEIQKVAGITINVPNFSGMPWQNAQAEAKKIGLECEFFPGEPAKDAKLKWIVYDQLPKPASQVQKDEVIKLRVYDDPQQPAE